MKFCLFSRSWELQLHVLKREAKCTLLMVRHLLLFVHYFNSKFETLFFC